MNMNIIKTANDRYKVRKDKAIVYRWKLPTVLPECKGFKEINRMNRFLEFMERRIAATIKRDPRLGYEKFNKFTVNSRTWAMWILYRSDRRFFLKWNEEEVWWIMKRFVNNLKNNKLMMEYFRVYIQEPHKLQSFEVPFICTKMMYVHMNEFMLKLIEPKLGKYQHGFRPGNITASIKLINGLLVGKKNVYEFDLNKFFNKVNADEVISEITKVIPDLGLWIDLCTRHNIPKNPDKINDDGEIERLDSTINVWKNVHERNRLVQENSPQFLKRRGFREGVNWSPVLLIIYAIELSGLGRTPGLIMYEDDGVILMNDEEERKFFLNKANWAFSVLLNKYRGFKREFKFLGINYQLDTQELSFEDKKGSIWNLEDVRKILKYTKYNGNSKESSLLTEQYGDKGWTWVSKDDALFMKTPYSEKGDTWVKGNTGVTKVRIRTISGESLLLVGDILKKILRRPSRLELILLNGRQRASKDPDIWKKVGDY